MQILVRKAQRGDPEAFVSLIEENKSSLYRVAKGFFQSEDDIADAISETVLSAYEHIGDLKRSEYFRTWLIRILINCCNGMLRERKRCEVTEVFPEIRYLENDFSMWNSVKCCHRFRRTAVRFCCCIMASSFLRGRSHRFSK